MVFDTTPEAARVQREIIRGLSGVERLQIACELSEATRLLTLAGLRRRMPGATEQELVVRLIELCYGRDALEKVTR